MLTEVGHFTTNCPDKQRKTIKKDKSLTYYKRLLKFGASFGDRFVQHIAPQFTQDIAGVLVQWSCEMKEHKLSLSL